MAIDQNFSQMKTQKKQWTAIRNQVTRISSYVNNTTDILELKQRKFRLEELCKVYDVVQTNIKIDDESTDYGEERDQF